MLTSNDMYLLEKLLIHAQDRICLIQKLEKSGKGTKHFSKEYLDSVRSSPLNQLIQTLKDSNTPDKTLIEPEKLSNDDTAIKTAVENALNNLKAFYQTNKKCLKNQMILDKNRNSIQDNIQPCNYNKFLLALDGVEENNLEAILHFINANQVLKKDGNALIPERATIAADAGLDNLPVAEIVKSIVAPAPAVKPEETPPTATDPKQAECEAKNSQVEGYISHGAKKQFTWNSKSKECDKSNAETATEATPDSGDKQEKATPSEIKLGTPQLQQHIVAPPKSGPRFFMGVQ